MRSYLLTYAFICSLLLLANAASAEEPRALLDRAIEAHGGAGRLERTKKGRLKAKIEGVQVNAPFTYEIEEWFDLPSRYKQIAHFSSSGTALQREIAYVGKEGWSREGTKAVRTERRESFSLRDHWYAVLAELLLLREKEAQLTSLPMETKDGRTLLGIRAVYSKLSGDFFFDKSTGLLEGLKVTPPVQESIETHYDDYRDIQGIHYPMRFKVVKEGLSSTVALLSLEFGKEIDDTVFLKPQTPVKEGRDAEAPADGNDEKTLLPRDRMLVVATVGAGIVIGAVWLLVRASKRGKRETPPS